jgi:hypothetical protein
MAAPNVNDRVNVIIDGLNVIQGGIGMVIPQLNPLINLLDDVVSYISTSSHAYCVD